MSDESITATLRPRPDLPGLRPHTTLSLAWTDGTGLHTTTVTQRATIGSAFRADVVVSDPTVSRLHAEIEPRERTVWVRDLGSRNGTIVDGLRVREVQLNEGSRIHVGAVTLTIRSGSTSEPLWPDAALGSIIGQSNAMRELFMRIPRAAVNDHAVLLTGETGTGKELVARELHAQSKRARGPFVTVDCTSLPEHLAESELFGYAKGAFTGAGARKIGAIEDAHGGTVFLDEIGELPLSMQAKLLRVLETKTIRRVGETAYQNVDVRFVSATHRDLQSMVNAGLFREDLYFRLAGIPLHLPPLRDRLEDVLLLAAHFMGGPDEVTPELQAELLTRRWQGNVRELRNFCHLVRAMGLAEAISSTPQAVDRSSPSTLPPPTPPSPLATAGGPFRPLRDAHAEAFERDYFRAMLAKHGRDVSAIAAEAEIDRSYAGKKLRDLGL